MFDTLSQQMDRMMRDTERLFATFIPQLRQPQGERRGEMARLWQPTCDMHMADNDLVVQCDLPGVDPNAVEVNTTRNSITISGEMKEECTGPECVMHERMTGRFLRQITLPEEINSDQVKAQFKNGMLTVRAPLAETSRRRPHKVAIESAK